MGAKYMRRTYRDSESFALSGDGWSGETSGPPYVIAGTLEAGLTYRPCMSASRG
jgi:hypothetical protein